MREQIRRGAQQSTNGRNLSHTMQRQIRARLHGKDTSPVDPAAIWW